MDNLKKWKSDPSKGEVFTPIELVNLILDKIPSDVWTNPSSTFLDPCMGTGTFLSEIVRRLVDIYGYSELDAKSRVYGYEIRIKYINKLKRRGYVNIQHKDFLSDEIEMKFDVVIGNPPYQDYSKIQGKNSSLWTKFIIKSNELLEDGGYLAMITPFSWIGPNESQKNELKKVFYDNNLIYLNTECKKFFKVGSTFSYFIIKKENTYIGTSVNNSNFFNLNLPFLPNIINENTISIANKVFFLNEEKLSFSSSLRNDSFDNNGQYNVWYGNKIKKSNLLGGNYNKQKVIVNKPGYLNPRYDDSQYNTSANNYWVEVLNSDEADNLISFFNCKLGKLIMEKLFKYSGYNSLGVLKNLPEKIKLHNWNDEKFKTVFNLTEEEINELYRL